MILHKFKTAFATIILGILCALNHCEAVQEQDIHFIDSQDVKRDHDNSKLQWDWAMDSLAKLPFQGMSIFWMSAAAMARSLQSWLKLCRKAVLLV